MKKFTLLLLIFIAIVCATAFAQETKAPVQVKATTEVSTAPAVTSKPRFDVGIGYWYTWASMDSYVYASSTIPGIWSKGDKISELDNNLDAGLFIVNAEAYLFWRLYVDGFVGWSDFSGEHKDYDWFPDYSSDIYSLSKSDADGNVVTWNANGYFRIIEGKEDKGYLDASIGYFYYSDDIEHIRNSTQVILDYEVVNDSNYLVGHDSQDKYTFDGLRLGARGKIRLHDRVAIKASGGITPWATAKDEAYWNLRGMRIDCEADATIYDFNIGLEFKITKYLFIEGGYKYINLDSDKGDDTRTFDDGSPGFTIEDAFEADGNRGGFYLMGRLKI